MFIDAFMDLEFDQDKDKGFTTQVDAHTQNNKFKVS